jgi:hypothetical protein
MKINTLTSAQEEKLVVYRDNGIKAGLATDQGESLEWAKEVTQEHRKLCGVAPANRIIILDSPFAACKEYGVTPAEALYGQHDVSWLYFYAFFRHECGLVEETDKIKYLLELTKVGWMWFGRNTTLITRRPISISLQSKKDGPSVLHNETDMALKYRDGTGLYSLGGVRIPNNYSNFILNKESAKPTDILNIPNTEIRSEIIKMLGPDFMFNNLNKKTLDSRVVANGGEYELYKVTVGDAARTYLTGVCPSKGDRWHEPVHPDCTNVLEALNWREWGSVSKSYLPPLVRT